MDHIEVHSRPNILHAPEFCAHPHRVPIFKDGVSFDFVKTRLKSIALAACYGYDSQQLPHNISKAEIAALNELCRNKNIVIIRPDKGNGVVILNRVDYVNKVLTLLGDRSEFSKLDGDALELCLKREIKLMRLLRDKLLKENRISEEVYQQLCPSGSTPGILYGLPNVHKQDCPARPILSAIGTYNYKLAKFLVPILQPFTVDQYTVKDSFSFVKEITSTGNQGFVSIQLNSLLVAGARGNHPISR